VELAIVIISILGLVTVITAIGKLYVLWSKRAGSYFIRQATDEQKRALTAASIRFYESSHPDGGGGISIKRKHLAAACQALNVYLVATFPTQQKRLHEMAFRPLQTNTNTDQYVVSCPNVRDTNPLAVDSALRRLVADIVVPKVRMNVQVHFGRGSVIEPIADDNFHIILGGAPVKVSNHHATPSPFFGIATNNDKLGRRMWSFQASGLGVPLTAQNVIYGELVGNCLYIKLWNQSGLKGWEIALLQRMLEHCAEELDPNAMIERIMASIPDDGLPAPIQKLVVFDEGFDARRKPIVRQLIHRIFAPAVHNHVHIKECSGRRQSPYRDEMFHIFHNSTPASIQQKPSGLGLVLFDESGAMLGELIENNLYLYSAGLKYGSRPEIEEYVRTLVQARRELVAEQSTVSNQIHSERLANACMKQAKSAESVDQTALTANLADADKKLRAALIETREAERTVFKVENSPDTALTKEFNDMLRLAKVRGVRVTETVITVDTDMMYCRDPRSGKLHRIGEFEINIGIEGGISFRNKAGAIQLANGSHMMAPHVNSGGSACLGNTRDQFPDLIRDRQYASAVALALLFLESVNVNDSWGGQIAYFPVVEEPQRPKQ
jgi:hypothetical protein